MLSLTAPNQVLNCYSTAQVDVEVLGGESVSWGVTLEHGDIELEIEFLAMAIQVLRRRVACLLPLYVTTP
jgi:hypothetical protein